MVAGLMSFHSDKGCVKQKRDMKYDYDSLPRVSLLGRRRGFQYVGTMVQNSTSCI